MQLLSILCITIALYHKFHCTCVLEPQTPYLCLTSPIHVILYL